MKQKKPLILLVTVGFVCFAGFFLTFGCGKNTAKPSFPLNNLARISLDKITIIPALNGWVLCDADARNEQLLVMDLKAKKIAISTKGFGWKPRVLRKLDSDVVMLLPLGFFSPKGTAVVYYEVGKDKKRVREEIDLNTGAVISSENLLFSDWSMSVFVGPLPLTMKKGLAKAMFREHGLGKVICFTHTDPSRLLVYDFDELFYLDLEAKRLQKIDEHVYSEGRGEFLPHWAGYQDLVTYFKRVGDPSDTMELYVANTGGISKCIYATSLKEQESTYIYNLFIASPNEAWTTLFRVKEQVWIVARVGLEYTNSRY